MQQNKIQIGIKGESIAVDYLTKLKYKIMQRNYRCHFGEIDIIAYKDLTYIFVEVKTRRSLTFGRPIEAINYKKRNHIQKVAQYYIQSSKIQSSRFRFDAIEVILSPEIQINHIKNIFF